MLTRHFLEPLNRGHENRAHLLYHTSGTKPAIFIDALHGGVKTPEMECTRASVTIHQSTVRTARGAVVFVVVNLQRKSWLREKKEGRWMQAHLVDDEGLGSRSLQRNRLGLFFYSDRRLRLRLLRLPFGLGPSLSFRLGSRRSASFLHVGS